MTNIQLQSSDGKIFDADIQIAKCSGTIKIMLEVCGMEDADNAVVPLPNLNSTILRKVLKWANYHRDDPLPVADEANKNRSDDMSAWDAHFLQVDNDTLIDLILAGTYLDIKGLREVACKAVANRIKGRKPQEIAKVFNI